jgi:hypothetical protein
VWLDARPILGTDWVQDDNAWNPPYFQVNFLGEKKVLINIQDPAKAFSAASYVGIPGPTAGAFPDWPKAGTGHCVRAGAKCHLNADLKSQLNAEAGCPS